MEVIPATDIDFDAFLRLAAEVEKLFGPMVAEADFHDAVRRNIRRGSALLARDGFGVAEGGLMFSHHRHPTWTVGWLVVTEFRRSSASCPEVEVAGPP